MVLIALTMIAANILRAWDMFSDPKLLQLKHMRERHISYNRKQQSQNEGDVNWTEVFYFEAVQLDFQNSN